MNELMKFCTAYRYVLEKKDLMTDKQTCDYINDVYGFSFSYSTFKYYKRLIVKDLAFPDFKNLVFMCSMKALNNKIVDTYGVEFHGLMICFKNMSKYFSADELITKKNYQEIATLDGIIYAKRFLHLFDVNDIELKIDYDDKINRKIDIKPIYHSLHNNFEEDYKNLIIDLHKKEKQFIIDSLNL